MTPIEIAILFRCLESWKLEHQDATTCDLESILSPTSFGRYLVENHTTEDIVEEIRVRTDDIVSYEMQISLLNKLDREADFFRQVLLARVKLFLEEMEQHFEDGDSETDSVHLQTVHKLLSYM
tara:strand:- start:154 stop:522 length:369 start_codon:yes stop_codon:yes gene_type:complete